MGQHKSNPIAIAASKGELPPKPKSLGKKESDRILYNMIYEYMFDKIRICPGNNDNILINKQLIKDKFK